MTDGPLLLVPPPPLLQLLRLLPRYDDYYYYYYYYVLLLLLLPPPPPPSPPPPPPPLPSEAVHVLAHRQEAVDVGADVHHDPLPLHDPREQQGGLRQRWASED